MVAITAVVVKRPYGAPITQKCGAFVPSDARAYEIFWKCVKFSNKKRKTDSHG
ncbi:hypothetical protein CBM2592_B100342 [Cupriavidus taiwanensis]|nr:hypothetical protein CBM2592_B100342 [Cupriavidus taiwanensis]SOY63034.1 hypothetical protein CBM2588_B130005 [Cupriavidus taiwanensis]SOY98129.1 hypothetical protein CBM2591_B80344 [Cupriavidus taiwanensis]SOZ85163.1 hypothetical protein CBM2618_B130020 [Cupriavidus taiwanensis]SOZ88618.1 hypothetical protein CBM2622_B140022 [Cupriavidus taiwanensis]